MEIIKPKASDSKKIATKAEDEKKTKKDDVMTSNGQKLTTIKGHLKIIEGLRQGKTKDDQSRSPRSSSSSYVMEIKMGNCEFLCFLIIVFVFNYNKVIEFGSKLLSLNIDFRFVITYIMHEPFSSKYRN